MASYTLGSALMLGGQPSITGYIVDKIVLLDDEIHNKYEVDDAAGKRAAIIIPSTNCIYPKVQLSLTCLSAAAPDTAFPKGKLCTVAPYAADKWYVESVTWDKEAKPNTVSVTLIK